MIFVEFEISFEKIYSCENNSAKSCKLSVKKHAPCGSSLPIKLAYDDEPKKTKSSWHMHVEFMDKFCNILKDNDIGISNSEQKNVLPLFEEKLQSYLNSKACYIFDEFGRILRF